MLLIILFTHAQKLLKKMPTQNYFYPTALAPSLVHTHFLRHCVEVTFRFCIQERLH